MRSFGGASAGGEASSSDALGPMRAIGRGRRNVQRLCVASSRGSSMGLPKESFGFARRATIYWRLGQSRFSHTRGLLFYGRNTVKMRARQTQRANTHECVMKMSPEALMSLIQSPAMRARYDDVRCPHVCPPCMRPKHRTPTALPVARRHATRCARLHAQALPPRKGRRAHEVPTCASTPRVWRVRVSPPRVPRMQSRASHQHSRQ